HLPAGALLRVDGHDDRRSPGESLARLRPGEVAAGRSRPQLRWHRPGMDQREPRPERGDLGREGRRALLPPALLPRPEAAGRGADRLRPRRARSEHGEPPGKDTVDPGTLAVSREREFWTPE